MGLIIDIKQKMEDGKGPKAKLFGQTLKSRCPRCKIKTTYSINCSYCYSLVEIVFSQFAPQAQKAILLY